MARVLLLFVLLVHSVHSMMHEDFLKFVAKNFGVERATRFNRVDLGRNGSFGGGPHHAGRTTKHEPVIVVHGLTSHAGDFAGVRDTFINNGYSLSEIYGTTWGNPNADSAYSSTSLDCKYVKTVRQLISAVHLFTRSKVDILAYSMGSPIARKAILGGRCVDTGEQLGPPLTNLVDTFVGVAGANFGAMLCEKLAKIHLAKIRKGSIPTLIDMAFDVAGKPKASRTFNGIVERTTGTCSKTNGLDCESKFLADINSRMSRYEGAHIFSIYSKDDDAVGYQVCGQIASSINGQDDGIVVTGKSHSETMYGTFETQFNLVTKHADVQTNQQATEGREMISPLP